MKFKNLVLAFGLLSVLSVQAAHAAPAYSQDEQFVYIKWRYGDMEDFRQEELKKQFVSTILEKLKTEHIPQGLDNNAIAQLNQTMADLQSVINYAQSTANDYRDRRGMEDIDLVPSGIFAAFGGNLSVSTTAVTTFWGLPAGVGAGGSLMLDFAMAPTRKVTISKRTGEIVDDRTESNLSVGGLAQGGVGMAATGAAFRFAGGLIWGDLPDINKLISGGAALGFTINEGMPKILTKLPGIGKLLNGAKEIPYFGWILNKVFGAWGFTGISLVNPDTGLRNFVTFIYSDAIGVKSGFEGEGVVYYFLGQDDVPNWVQKVKNCMLGNCSAPLSTPTPTPVPTVTVTPSPTPSASSSGTPVVTQPPIPPSGNGGPIAVHPPVILTDDVSAGTASQPLTSAELQDLENKAAAEKPAKPISKIELDAEEILFHTTF